MKKEVEKKQKRVMFRFDDDEPMHLDTISEGGEFILKLRESYIKFEKGGKTFELYVEEHDTEQLRIAVVLPST